MRIGQRDLRRAERGGRDLVEQGLEEMVIAPVDDGDLDVRAFQRLHGGKSAKAAADHDDTVPVRGGGHFPNPLFTPHARDMGAKPASDHDPLVHNRHAQV